MSADSEVDGVNSYSEGQGEVGPQCSIVCNVGCDFWSLVRLKERILDDGSTQHTGRNNEQNHQSQEKAAQHFFIRRCPCLLSVLCSAFLTDREQSIVLDMLNTADGADASIERVDDIDYQHGTTSQVVETIGNENSTLNKCMKSTLYAGQGQVRQVTPIQIDQEQENEGDSPTRSPTRVQFSPKLVSEVHLQEKVDVSERRKLFYSEYEESKWRMDRMREIGRAKALGMTWAEWMEKRTDEDVKREERYGVNPFKPLFQLSSNLSP